MTARPTQLSKYLAACAHWVAKHTLQLQQKQHGLHKLSKCIWNLRPTSSFSLQSYCDGIVVFFPNKQTDDDDQNTFCTATVPVPAPAPVSVQVVFLNAVLS
jgi:hypothetical protein